MKMLTLLRRSIPIRGVMPAVITVIMLLVGAGASFGQAPAVDWHVCLGGTSRDMVYTLAKTSDSGCIVAGPSESTDGDVAATMAGWIIGW